jgi:hypothetical protein
MWPQDLLANALLPYRFLPQIEVTRACLVVFGFPLRWNRIGEAEATLAPALHPSLEQISRWPAVSTKKRERKLQRKKGERATQHKINMSVFVQTNSFDVDNPNQSSFGRVMEFAHSPPVEQEDCLERQRCGEPTKPRAELLDDRPRKKGGTQDGPSVGLVPLVPTYVTR